MKTFKQLLESIQAKDTAVLTYGRMSPPTVGHAKLIDNVLSQPGHHHIVVSHTQDNKKNPLSGQEKVDLLKQMYPEHAHKFHASDKQNPTIFHHAAQLHKQGYKHLHVVVGADRVEEFKKNLNKYNGKFDENGNGYNFKSITVSSAGDRDPDAEGVEGMSASKMRQAALSGDHETFKSGLHPNIHHLARKLMNTIRDRIK
jgi:phosphopantetheine adenylyltransferase